MDWYYEKYLEECDSLNVAKEERLSEEEFKSSKLRLFYKRKYFAQLYGSKFSSKEVRL